MNFQQKLDNCARLVVQKGVNLKEKEGVVINASIEAAPLARLVTKYAYEAGAKDVFCMFTDDEMTLIRYQYGKEYVFENVPQWLLEMQEGTYKDNYAWIRIHSPNPELLKSVDQKLVAEDMNTRSKASSHLMKYLMADLNKWTIIGYANKKWAKLVFPELDEDEALDKLWDALFKVTRADYQDPIKAWEEHDADLKSRVEFFAKHNFEKFHYTAQGTDFEVYMPENHLWFAGSVKQVGTGVSFFPNMPTEEVFSAPHCMKINGKLKSTMPLALRGQLIDGFGFTFKDGVVVDFYAEKGYEVLKGLLDSDEGARRLGEIALVAHNSPISNTGILFNDTLYDENASCHFALGKSYQTCIKDGTQMSDEELLASGMNDSIIHVDFMVGGPTLNIVGYTKSGEAVQVFKDGNWAF